MMKAQELVKEELDYEWMMLIMEAKQLGIDKDEIRKFLSNNEAKN